MDILIAQYNIKQIQVLHCLLIQINAIAGFYSNYIINAIEFYNKVVILSKKYADLMKSPLIQRQVKYIHLFIFIYYNSSNVLIGTPRNV